MDFLPLLAFSLAVFFATAVGTRALIPLLRRVAIDNPNARSSHVVATPRGGGIAVILVVAVGWAVAWATGAANGSIWPLLPALILALVGWLDDRRGLSPGLRLCVQFAAVVGGLATLDLDLTGGLLPSAVEHVAAGLAWVWFINLFNFMDGIDGIAASETAAVTAGAVLLSILVPGAPELGLPALLLGAASCGFLLWNWSPAKLFMGDVGSLSIGYLLGWLLLGLASHGLWAAAAILPLYHLADATLTLLRRLHSGHRPWHAHRQHFYQRASRGLGGHAVVVRQILALNALLILLAALSIDHPVAALLIAVLLTGLLLLRFERAEAYDPR